MSQKTLTSELMLYFIMNDINVTNNRQKFQLSQLRVAIMDFSGTTKLYSIRKWFLMVLAFFTCIVLLLCLTVSKRSSSKTYRPIYKTKMGAYERVYDLFAYDELSSVYDKYSREKWRLFGKNQCSKFSRLGRILFLNKKYQKLNQAQKNYSILIWNYKSYIKLRPHMKQSRPFLNCSVKNCFIEKSNTDFSSAAIIIFDIKITRSLISLNKSRKKNQIWAFLSNDSPLNTFSWAQKKNLSIYDNLFNWSMTYRMDSDIPIPYGRTVTLNIGEKGLIQKYSQWNENKKQDVLVAIVSSNCKGENHRWNYIKILQKYLQIDIYGKCGNKTCLSDLSNVNNKNVKNDCAEISKYKFYLAFENSNCAEYITEKVWWYGYAKNTIPIVMGSSYDSYHPILPPDSFLNIENFAHPRDLANYIIYLNNTPTHIQEYFKWKKYFKVLNEHGHFHTKSVEYCRICEALNYNSKKKKIYKSLKVLWNSSQCYPSWDSD